MVTLAFGLLAPASVAAGREHPNVILIITDDQQVDEVGAYGGDVYTPNIDRLASEGVLFENGYSVISVCTPSRYAMYTGRYPSRCTHADFLDRSPPGQIARPSNRSITMEPERPNLMKALAAAGYTTGLAGKWHVGEWMAGWQEDGVWKYPPGYYALGLQSYPADACFDNPEFIAALQHNQAVFQREVKKVGWSDAMSIVFANPREFHHNVLSKTHNPEWITYGALEFIRRNQDRPFFLTMAMTLPHLPDPLLSLDGSADPRATGAGWSEAHLDAQPPRVGVVERVRNAGFDPSTAHITWLDDSVGALVDEVEKLGLTRDTVFIFVSDHSLDGKASLYEDGVHIPVLVSWPGKIMPRHEGGLVQNLDLTPTILELTGAKPLPDMTLDGRSWAPLLFTKSDEEWRDDLFYECGYARAVRFGKWKYIAVRYPEEIMQAYERGELKQLPYWEHNTGLGKIQADTQPHYWELDQLYDLEVDPEELTNLATDPQHAATLAMMRARMSAYLKQFPDRPYGDLHSIEE